MRKDIIFEVYKTKSKKVTYEWRMIKEGNVKCDSHEAYSSTEEATNDIKDLFPGSVRIKEV